MPLWVQFLVVLGTRKFLIMRCTFYWLTCTLLKVTAIGLAAILFTILRNYISAWKRKRGRRFRVASPCPFISSQLPAVAAVGIEAPEGGSPPSEVNTQPEQQEREARTFLQIIVSGFCPPTPTSIFDTLTPRMTGWVEGIYSYCFRTIGACSLPPTLITKASKLTVWLEASKKFELT